MRASFAVVLAAAAGPLAAQQGVAPGAATAAPSPAAMRRAADGMTAEQVTSYASVLGADSMSARAASGRGLARAAQYVAGQFAKLGLATSLQQYPLPGSRRMSPADSRVLFVARARKGAKELVDEAGAEMMKSVAVTFDGAAWSGVGALPEGPSGPGAGLGWLFGEAETKPSRVMVVSGRQTAASVAKAGLRQDVILYVPPVGIDSAARQRTIDLLRQRGSVVVLSEEDAAAFQWHRAATSAGAPAVIEPYAVDALDARRWVVYVRADALENFWRVAGFDVARARADTAPTVRDVAGMTAMIDVRAKEEESNGPSGVNAIGILQGTDPRLANSYVVVAARLDDRSVADGGATTTSALLALAKAFSQSDARPRRSMIFVATSGAVDGVGLGAEFFAQSPPVGPMTVAIALDGIGAGPRDSVVVDGADDAEFAARPAWVAADHSELGLAIVDGGTASDPTQDHFAFVRRAVPTLAFHGDGEADTAAAGKAVKDDATKAATVARVVFYVGQALANATNRPNWSSGGRQARLAALER